MLRPVALGIVAALLLIGSGCRNRSEVLETELRSKDRDLSMLRDELERNFAHTQALQTELQALRRPAFHNPFGADPVHPVYPVRKVTLGRGTGGKDEDCQPGDELLVVVLEPRDEDNQVVKVPGSVAVQALEITPEGLKVPFSSWEVSPEQLRTTWKTGLLMTGYVLTLAWQNCPSCEKVRVVVRYQTLDGRTYEAERDVTVRLLPPERRHMPRVEDGAAVPKPAPAPGTPAPGPSLLPTPGPTAPSPPTMPPGVPERLPPPKPVPPSGTPPAPLDGPLLEPAGLWRPAAKPLTPPPAGLLKPVVSP